MTVHFYHATYTHSMVYATYTHSMLYATAQSSIKADEGIAMLFGTAPHHTLSN